ncbi:hypothetical protein CITSP_00537 [Citrobacter sp. T1.2D-1]|nr:hypothetical protein CITSP_00537 [Citrobacter sp. T1.2D-1]
MATEYIRDKKLKMGTFPKRSEDHKLSFRKRSTMIQERVEGMTIWRRSLRPLICSISWAAAWRPASA